MAERRPSLIFRFAGLFTLGMLAVLALAYGWFAPKPEIPGSGLDGPAEPPSTPEWEQAKAWVGQNPGYAIIVCDWPVDLPRGGRVALGAEDAPSFWQGGALVQAVPADERGGVVLASDGSPRAWVAFHEGRCEVLPPVRVRVDGRVVDGSGTALPDQAVEGCGQEVATDGSGVFRIRLSHPALLVAVPDDSGRPRCDIGRKSEGSTRTPIDLSRGGVQPIVVQ